MNQRFLQILFSFYLLISTLSIFGQEYEPDLHKLLKQADEYFDNEKYSKALPLYLTIDSLETDSYIKYQIGACYLNSKYHKIKALPYLEEASKDTKLEIPKTVYKDLGILYHLDYQFDNAIDYFNKYIKITDKDDKNIAFAQRMIEICENAKILSAQNHTSTLEFLGLPVNTKNSEYRPLISADESVLYFVREKVTSLGKDYGFEVTDKVKIIMVTIKEGLQWSDPRPLVFPEFENETEISLAGLSPDGQMLFFTLKTNDQTDIYYCKPVDYIHCEKLIRLNSNINSKFNEGNVSITSDGRDLYFSSNRPGGNGLMDIYKSTLDDSGDWGPAENLGSVINTSFNDESPFIHPDGKTLYFSSQGHMTMGGYDIFKTAFRNETKKWDYPKNIGYPNTTGDDIDFVLTASGQMGYFSSNRNTYMNRLHIFRVDMKNSLPLTMVKGKILAGNPLKPLSAKIRVVDNETRKLIKYVYSPNTENGKYLMIFPPGKNYDMIIEAPGFLPQLINIYIPNQTYFYELFQEIHLIPIKALGKVVGEEIFVKNTFYDIYKTNMGDSMRRQNLRKGDKEYTKLVQLVEDIISTTDSSAADVLDKQIPNPSDTLKPQQVNYDKLLKLIEEAIETTDSVTLTLLDNNTVYDENANQTFFYPANNDKTHLHPTIIGKDTIYTSQPLDSRTKNLPKDKGQNIKLSKEIIRDNPEEVISMKLIPENQRKIILFYQVFFYSNDATINPEYYDGLNEVNRLLINNPNIGVLIYGHSDTSGDEQKNLMLSQERAKKVFDYFVDRGLNPKKAIIIGLGEQQSSQELSEKDRQQNRRVDIQVFEVLKYER